MAELGPLHYYEHGRSTYPILLYVLWPIGLVFDGDALRHVVKGLSIPFDLALGILIYFVASRVVVPGLALVASALYLFNPVSILAGPVWGQVDAAGSLAYLGALAAAAGLRFGLSGGLGVVAGLVKAQYGLVLLPVITAAAVQWRRIGEPRNLLAVLVGGGLAYVATALPFGLDPISLLSRVSGVVDRQPRASLYAANPWGVVFGFEYADDVLFGIGAVLVIVGLSAALIPLLHRVDLETLLAVGVFVVFAFFFLPTRVHERYLVTAFAVLAPLAVTSSRLFACYVALSLAYAVSLVSALAHITDFTLGEPWNDILLSRPANVIIGLAVTGIAAVTVLLLVRRVYGAPQGGRSQPDRMAPAGQVTAT